MAALMGMVVSVAKALLDDTEEATNSQGLIE